MKKYSLRAALLLFFAAGLALAQNSNCPRQDCPRQCQGNCPRQGNGKGPGCCQRNRTNQQPAASQQAGANTPQRAPKNGGR